MVLVRFHVDLSVYKVLLGNTSCIRWSLVFMGVVASPQSVFVDVSFYYYLASCAFL